MGESVDDSLKSFEGLTGLSVTVHALHPTLLRSGEPGGVPGRFRSHTSPFCMKVKEKRLARCMQCDNRELHEQCRPGEAPFPRRCHAGAWEVIAPIYRWNTLAGMLFVGQFRRKGDPRRRGVSGLPLLNDDDVRQLTGVARMAAAYIRSLTDPVMADPDQGSGRSRDIEAFIRSRISGDVRLTDLAEHLHLSPSRTSHLVRQEAALSFRELKENIRLAISKDLLAHGNGSIRWVAEQVGMRDADYFCRYFKKKTGQSPGRFRGEYGVSTV